MAGLIPAAGDYVLLEDLADVAGWMADAGRIPPFVRWSPDAMADAQAAQAEAANDGMF